MLTPPTWVLAIPKLGRCIFASEWSARNKACRAAIYSLPKGDGRRISKLKDKLRLCRKIIGFTISIHWFCSHAANLTCHFGFCILIFDFCRWDLSPAKLGRTTRIFAVNLNLLCLPQYIGIAPVQLCLVDPDRHSDYLVLESGQLGGVWLVSEKALSV